ncbi:uncharacterized protein PAC_13624 [Phialocephala subalpina]|uniref:Uncharacterized protein n=1 Tax=Phialocephala subalpina TaxID=576137 RepID=A0A1L7XFL2_9HELO|nr:uncharacterized protein PAC_13624 [Phialocephala subalpina]
MGMQLSYLLGIVLGCLVAVAFGAGLIKLYINKRRLKANQQKADEGTAAKASDREKLVAKRKMGEGDYFGVRALEHGYFGGVAQTSRPSSPGSVYKLAPDAKVVDWGQVNKLRSDSSSVGSSTFDFLADRNSSTSSLPTGTSTIKKPSPLRLQPSLANIHGKQAHNMSSVGGVGGNFLPPPPSPRSIRAPSPLFNEEKSSTWISPLDVHFSRPSTPSRPTSYLPKLQFPIDSGKTELSVPLPDFSGYKSETASIVSTEVLVPPPTAHQGRAKSPTLSTFSGQETFAKSPTASTFSKEAPPKVESPTFSAFPHQPAPPRPARLSLKGMFDTEEAPVRSPKDDFSKTFQLPPVPLDDLAPRLPAVNPDRFPPNHNAWGPTSPVRDSILNKSRQAPMASDSNQWPLPSPTLPDSMMDQEWQPSENAVIRASVVSKQRVSIIQRQHQQPQDLDFQFSKMNNRIHSIAASSMYSTRTSILETEDMPNRHARTRSQSSEARRSIKERANSSHKRTSSRSLSRTRDSVRDSRTSQSFKSASSHRRSRERDQLHFDPTSHRRNRSGSVQGRSVDFDQPRESPFSNSNQTNHSPSSSVSSSTSSLSRFETSPQKPILQHQANTSASLAPPIPARTHPFQIQDPDRLSIAHPQTRGRSPSEASQNSIGDFYDSYYRQSTMGANGGQAVPMGPGQGSRTSVHDRAIAFEDKARGRSGSFGARRPPPLKTNGNGNLSVEQGGYNNYGGFTPIVEVASPVPSPLVGGGERGRERFATMI